MRARQRWRERQCVFSAGHRIRSWHQDVYVLSKCLSLTNERILRAYVHERDVSVTVVVHRLMTILIVMIMCRLVDKRFHIIAGKCYRKGGNEKAPTSHPDCMCIGASRSDSTVVRTPQRVLFSSIGSRSRQSQRRSDVATTEGCYVLVFRMRALPPAE